MGRAGSPPSPSSLVSPVQRGLLSLRGDPGPRDTGSSGGRGGTGPSPYPHMSTCLSVPRPDTYPRSDGPVSSVQEDGTVYEPVGTEPLWRFFESFVVEKDRDTGGDEPRRTLLQPRPYSVPSGRFLVWCRDKVPVLVDVLNTLGHP